MADIASQLNSVRNADSFTSLKEAIYETLDAISKAGIENDAIKDIQRTLMSLNKKIDEMDDSDDSLRTDITRLKDVIGSINKLVNSKADSKTLDQFKTDVDKKNSEFETAILQKADKNTVNQIEKDLSGKADVDAVNEELSKKADISTVNTIEKELSEKMDAESIASILSSKADISTVNTIEKELSDKVSTESFASALSGKADAEDINKLLSSPVMGIRVASAPGNVTTLKLNIPAYSGAKAITRGGDDTNFNDGEDGGSDLPGTIGDNETDQTGGSSGDTGFDSGDTGGTGSIDSTTELVALSYLNTVVGNINQEINGKVDQHTFDEIVGDGFNTWTITDYIIRLREDWNTALNGMLTKQYADEVAHDAADTLSSIIMIDESPTEETKLLLETTEEDFELVEKDEFDAVLNEYNQIFTFTWKGAFELGGIDEHGWKANVAGYARSVDLLGARDFTCTLNSKYIMEVASYDHYKLYIDTTLPMNGEVTYNLYDHPGAEYIRLLVKNYDDSDIDDVGEVSDDITLTMFGVDWTGKNVNKPVDITLVDRVSDRTSTLETEQIRNNSRLTTLETNVDAADHDILSLQSKTVAIDSTLEGKVAALSYGEDGMLYYWGDTELTIMLGSVGPLVSGSGSWNGQGGGGGGSSQTNNAEMSFKNTSGWTAKTVSGSDPCPIEVTFTSTEEGSPTGQGTVKIYVNGVLKSTRGLNQGVSTIDVKEYLTSGTNLINLTANDVYDNVRYVKLTVSVVDLQLRSSFDTSVPFNGAILFTCVPIGNVTKTVYYILDGTEIESTVVETTGRQISYTIPAQAHGSHVLQVYAEAEIDGSEIRSNELYYEFISLDGTSDRPTITSSFNTQEVNQYSAVPIPYRVYSTRSETVQVKLYVNNVLVSTQYVDRTEQSYTLRADNAGEVSFKIEVEGASKTITFNVLAAENMVSAETDSLALYLTADGRSNNEAPAQRSTWSYEDISCTISGFNYKVDGWLTDNAGIDILRLVGDARVTIPYNIFERDFIDTGKTIEIEFATREVFDYEATVISCIAAASNDIPKLKVTPQNAMFRGAQTEIGTLYKDNEHVRLSIVVEKQNENRLILFYINGIMSRAIQYASGERFSQLNPVGITIGSNDCGIDIYKIRVYDNSLTRSQVLNNMIADISIGAKMLEAYARNDIYNENGVITTATLNRDIPYFIINTRELPQYKGDKKTVTGSYTDPVHPSKSFNFEGCEIDVQGTSSAPYYRKNYDMKYKNGFITTSGTIDNYGITDNSIPFNRFVIKADVASSESANNTGLTMFYNDTCPYKTAEMIEDSRVRWGIEGVPCLLFWNDETTNEVKFMGKYNFNLPKRCPAPLGYSGLMESWEVERNNSANVKFQDNDFDTLAWNELDQEWYPAWYDDFEARFPSDEYRDYTKIKTFLTWVKSTWRDQATNETLPSPVTYRLNSTITVNDYPNDNSFTVTSEKDSNNVDTGYKIFRFTKDTPAYRLTKFKSECPNYVEMQSAYFYYLFTTTFLMIDSWAKNMFIGFRGGPATDVPEFDRKIVFEPYDMDTAIGTNNSGVLMFGYWLEDTDRVTSVVSGGDSGSADAPVFNAQDSVFWTNLRDSFKAEISAMYRSLRANRSWSYQIVENRFEQHQSKWSEAIFNEDAYTKYLVPLIEPVTVDDEGRLIKTDRYLTMLQGAKTEQRKWWLWNRFRYLDSKYNTGDASTNIISIRLFNGGTLELTPAINMYVGVSFGGGTTPLLQRTNANETSQFPYIPETGVTEMETWIYSADLISDVGDLSIFYANEADFSKATRLRKLKLGSGASGYSNANLRTIDVRNSGLLEEIDCRNCPNLNITVNLEGSPRLEKAYFEGTTITGVELVDGGAIEVLHLPATVTTLTLLNLTKLTDFSIPSYSNITRLMLNNIDGDIVNPITILNQVSANTQVNIQNLDLTVSTAEEIDSFYDLLDTMQGVTRDKDANGEWLYHSYDTAQVSGVIHINAISGADMVELQDRYPSITIDAAHTASNRFYKTWDGSSIVKTVACVDGVPQEAAPSGPARTSTAQYNYTFIGWSKYTDSETADANLNEVNKADHSFYAAYSKAVRSYTINFVKASDDGGGTLETKTVAYGQTPSYTGTTPTTTKGSATDYPFEGWTPAITTVTGNATYTASFGSPLEIAEISDSWDTIIENIENGTYRNVYKVGNYKPLDFGTEGTVNMQIAAFDTDTASNGTGTVAMTMIPIESLKTTKRMNPSKTTGTEGTGTIGGWEKCEMRTYLKNTILPLIPANIRSHMISVTKTHPAYNTSETLFTQTTTDNIWIPSQDEVNNGTYKVIYKDDASRIKKNISTNSAYSWWLRSASSASGFRSVSSAGSLSGYSAYSAYGVVPCFCLSSEAQARTISYSDLVTAMDNDTYNTKFAVGDMFEVDLGSEGKIHAQIAAFDTDDKADDSGKAKVTCIAKEFLKTTHRMNPNNSSNTEGTGTIGGWEKCEMRTYLNDTIKPLIPTAIKNRMVSVTKTQDSYNASGTKVTQTTIDDIWIPSQPEINTGGSYVSLFPDQNSRIKKNISTNSANYWWLRSAGSANNFHSVYSSGYLSSYNAYYAYGVVPCFCLD